MKTAFLTGEVQVDELVGVFSIESELPISVLTAEELLLNLLKTLPNTSMKSGRLRIEFLITRSK
jgi:hypothetical protein